MSRIPEDVLDAIRHSVDLAELVGRYVPLRKAGRSWKACCPFHDEKTPSFVVWPETGTWKCFGCGKGGNLFGFLMEREGLSFPEAARQLARSVGISVDDDPQAGERASRLSRLREACEWACRLFETWLRRPEGTAAVEYLKSRGITGESAKLFRLGYAPPGWETLLRAALEAGFDEDLLVDAGLVIRRDEDSARGSGVYDRFRDRLVFPIADGQGRVIAFGARAFGDAQPKYLNSPETPLFRKGRHLYALHLAKGDMLRTGEGGVMEGYTDVVMSHQYGWGVSVAGLGTALTPEQASLVSRYVKRLWLLYDGDAAGRAAASRAISSFLPAEIETRVALLPPGEDPCDVLVNEGLEGLRSRLDSAPEAFDHMLTTLADDPDAASVTGRANAVDVALRALDQVTGQVRLSLYLDRVADRLSVRRETVAARFDELHRSKTRRAPAPPPEPGIDAWEDGDSVAHHEPPPPAERHLTEAVLRTPELLDEIREQLDPGALTHGGCRALLAHLDALWQGGRDAYEVGDALGRIQDPALARLAVTLHASGERAAGEHSREALERQGRDCLRLLAHGHENDRLQRELQEADEAGNQDDVLRRLAELHARRARRPNPE